MKWNELIDEIINIISYEKKDPKIIGLFGKNATWKTKTLNEIYKKIWKQQEYNCLYLRAETTFEDEMKNGTKDDELIGNIKIFINNIYHDLILINQKEILEKINEINGFLERLNNIKKEDPYFKSEILKTLKIDDNIKKQLLELKIEIDKNNVKNYSSGQGMYSLFLFCKEIISNIELTNNKKKNILIIDEPEKFCHNTLIKKIIRILVDLFQLNVSVIFSTHSSFLINEFVSITRKNNKENDFFLFNHKSNDIGLKNIFIEKISLDSIFNNKKDSGERIKINKREQEIIFSAMFDELVFLVEGLKDFEFISCIMENNPDFANEYYRIYDCSGDGGAIKISAILSNLNVNVFCVVDSDNKLEDKINELHNKNINRYYIFNPKIETELNDPNKNNKSNLEFYTFENISATHTYNVICEKIKNLFNEATNNINKEKPDE